MGREQLVVYYQVDYVEREIDEGVGYFHARWRRENPRRRTPGSTRSSIAPAVPGSYCGTYLAVGVNSPGWWGEGEFKFYLDGDVEFPTICGTGTEDYFGGAWDFDVPGNGYTTFSAPFIGLNQVVRPDGLYGSQQRFGMYRWHVPDPIAFESALRVTDPGPGLAPRPPVLEASRRHSLNGVLVPPEPGLPPGAPPGPR